MPTKKLKGTPLQIAIARGAGTPPKHLSWLANTGTIFSSKDKLPIELWEFVHQPDEEMIKEWARYFRLQYCSDDELDLLCEGTGLSRAEFLRKMVFPDSSAAPGPSVRSGDFAEILVADFLEYTQQFWVPRTRYEQKAMRNLSSPGTDVIGIKTSSTGKFSARDTLALYEVKAQFTGAKPLPRLQDAVNDSTKDPTRKSESLNAMKQRLLAKGRREEAMQVERFQNPEDRPFVETYGAVAFYSDHLFDSAVLKATDCANHPKRKRLKLYAMRGKDMMDLAHKLYEAAANAA